MSRFGCLFAGDGVVSEEWRPDMGQDEQEFRSGGTHDVGGAGPTDAPASENPLFAEPAPAEPGPTEPATEPSGEAKPSAWERIKRVFGASS